MFFQNRDLLELRREKRTTRTNDFSMLQVARIIAAEEEINKFTEMKMTTNNVKDKVLTSTRMLSNCCLPTL